MTQGRSGGFMLKITERVMLRGGNAKSLFLGKTR